MINRGLSIKAAGQVLRRLPGRDLPRMLASYPGPTLILNGERDRQNIKSAPQMAAAAQHASIRVIEDAGHACSLSQPDIFTGAVRVFANSIV
ncbi:MAG: alpha/beta fold hydrolase [Acidimicrobiia bacterium]